MKTYRVSGTRKVFGHEPGTTFKRDIPAAQEASLMKSGAIKESQAQNVDAVDRQPTTED
jgi:hypothetical protein